MKLAARFANGSLARRLARVRDEAEQAALDAAADALAEELARVREREMLDAPLVRGRTPRRRFVGADDTESVTRELGTLDRRPAPWLAPSLPGALSRLKR